MKITLSLLISLFLFLSTKPVHAGVRGVPVGFSMINQRNHPELKWQSVETEHFIISFPQHLSGIEAQAAAIAEATYEALSANLEVEFDYKIRIFLSDEDEIINGFAVPFPRAYTNIWVYLNQVAEAWSGPEKWMRTVIAHELAHIFHFEAVRSNIPLLGTLAVAPSMPVPWTEGIAQYYTEPWHALRGDDLLRKAFYDGRPSYTDGTSMRNRALMYAAGNAQLRYFASAYGDSLVPKILAHRQEPLGGIIRYHNFNKAFKDVVDKPFSDFVDEWRRHTNIYYHSLASQMERSDSLNADPEEIPGLFISDVRYSPDTMLIATTGLKSRAEPYQQLIVITNDSLRKRRVLAEGNFLTPLSWSPDAGSIAYASTRRGKHGSLLNDLYLVDVETGRRERLTHSRRASYPQFSPDGKRLYYVVNEQGTGNIFYRDLEDGSEYRLTSYEGDVQLGRIDMHPDGTHLAFARFEEDGSRHIIVLDLVTGSELLFTEAMHDDRYPLWSPDGRKLAYTSLRDHVPNLFVIEPFADIIREERVTALFAGGTALQWLPADSLHPEGTFVLLGSDTKRNNEVRRIDAARRAAEPDPVLNASYTRWLDHKPPSAIASHIDADESLILNRYAYNSWKNISHVSTIPFPYFSSSSDYGLGVLSVFSEPLSKHMISLAAAVSFTKFQDNSLVFLGYINNQLRPSISLNLYHNSFTGRFYERDYLVTTNSGAYALISLPLDWIDNEFVQTTLYTRLRYEYTDAQRFWDRSPVDLGAPSNGWQQDVRLGLRLNKQKPYVHRNIHPLAGWGLETRVTIASAAFGGETEYIRPDILGYVILPGLSDHRFYLYGRAIAQWGDAFPQDYVGFSRYDDIQFGGVMAGLDFLYSDTERVRGYRDYETGDRLLFGTLEYRIPFIDDLDTKLLGVVSLGRTTLSAFVDGGLVWNEDMLPGDDAVKRAGAGLELKNILDFGGLQILHSLGLAQPVNKIGKDDSYELYYRVRAVVPF
ncbi:MAG: DPP IV N-terminal domain-containing protein [Bacteroidales bacterium]|nr:DPP IV N-terminal domain-containing protein [Bacteroidales bacterium]